MTLTTVHRSARASVKLVPAAPEQVALDWAAMSVGSRWAMLAMFGAIWLLLVPGPQWLTANAVAGQVELATATSIDGEQVVLRFVRVEVDSARRPRRRTYVVEVATPSGSKQAAVQLRTKVGGACRVLPDGVLAVTSPRVPGRVLLLREDFWPLALPAAEVAAARARIAAHNDRVAGDAASGAETRGHGDAAAS